MAAHFRSKPRTVFEYYPGADLHRLSREAERIVISQEEMDDDNPTLVYFIGGLCDLTEKLRGERYEEVVFRGTPEGAVDRISNTLQACSWRMATCLAVPVFCTIPPMHIARWNNTRGAQRKTSYLAQSHLYGQMQRDLLQAARRANVGIIETNDAVGVMTPKLATQILQKKGAGRPHRFRHTRLGKDGVHPDDEVVRHWILDLETATSENRRRVTNS